MEKTEPEYRRLRFFHSFRLFRLMSGHFSGSESMGTRMTRIRTDQIREHPLRPRHPHSYSFAPLEKYPAISRPPYGCLGKRRLISCASAGATRNQGRTAENRLSTTDNV